MMKTVKLSCLLVLSLIINACSFPVTKVEVQSFALTAKSMKEDKALNVLTTVFVENGFDIKMTNKDAGIVTTELKKFASLEQNPPFDYFMQIKGRVKNNKNQTSVELTPIIREQNRMNAAAYTEHVFGYYVGDPNNVAAIRSMRAGTGWRALSQTIFMNVVDGTAKSYGMNFEDVVQNVSRTEVNAIGAN